MTGGPAIPTPPGGSGREGGENLNTSIQYIKGVGPKRAALFARLGVETVGDALYLFPRRYEDRRSVKEMGSVTIGLKETVAGEVTSSKVLITRRKRSRICEVTFNDGTGSVTGLWFHFREPYMKRLFTPGTKFLLHGEIRWDGMRMVIYHPETEGVGGEGDEPLHFGRIVPVYPLTEELGQRQVRKILFDVVRKYAPRAEDRLPRYLQEKYRLPGLEESLSNIHFPGDGADLAALNDRNSRWHKRLVFEEFFVLEILMAARRAEREKISRKKRLEDRADLLKPFLERLPFRLTGAQSRCFGEIKRDMLSLHPMNRLLEGDVGSGKTVVTAMAVLLAADNGFQSTIMAPTEILARQHLATMTELFEGLPVEVTLLVSSLAAGEKREVRERISAGEVQLAVGTHALIQEGVEFRDLGLVIIDEQQRFGVGHRLSLREKGDNPDTLVVTATPIPRTLAMTFYGDMDVSVIDEMPPGRRPVKTMVLEEGDRDRLYGLIEERLKRGEQGFVIYPLVEESEKLELKAAEKMAVHLDKKVFTGYRVGLIHGRMDTAAKEKVMAEFQAGRIHLLVSTTVVEVGVDIPGATVMVVEHAERFGLAQLHQLRGRVGRRGQEAVCLLVATEGIDEESRVRLDIMSSISDGFRLAEEDLKHRGPGEFAGVRQSGAPDLLLANLIRHRKALEFAREEAFEVVRGEGPGRFELTKLMETANIKWNKSSRFFYSG